MNKESAMNVLRKIIEIDDELCDGCGECVPSCAEGAIEIVDGKARLVADRYCDGLGACLGDCPMGALTIVEREVEEFDEDAVEELLKKKEAEEKLAETLACGCPSAQMQSFEPPAREPGKSPYQVDSKSELRQWPIQINLVPTAARFLDDAHLLIAADCTPFVYPDFHRDFIGGRVVLVGCPKLDDASSYVEKFTEIFKSHNIKSITIPIIEVPCCSGLPMIVKKAMENANKAIPTEVVVLGVKGGVLERHRLSA